MRRRRVHDLMLVAVLSAWGCSRGGQPSSSAAGNPEADASRAALAPSVLCSHSYLLLASHSMDDLQSGGYCKLCNDHDPDACELDWPSSDMMGCSEYDVMRHTIEASLGKSFDDPRWQTYFSATPWYRPDPAFTEARLSSTARANMATLVAREAECRKELCAGSEAEPELCMSTDEMLAGLASAVSTGSGHIGEAPLPRGSRLEPCQVVLEHTRVDEETGQPKQQRIPIRRLVREWDVEALRAAEWKTAAPIPVTIDQARELLKATEETHAGVRMVSGEVGDGSLTYSFDEAGRATSAAWDPTADSSAYQYEYRYTCSPAPAADKRPYYADDRPATP